MRSRRVFQVAAAATVVLVLSMLGGLRLRGAPAQSAGGEAAARTPPPLGATAGAASAAPAPSGPPVPAEEETPVPGCWAGLAAFDRGVTLETFRPALAAADAARDRYLAVYLQERLTELVGEDAGKALQVLAWAETSGGPELGVLMNAIKAAPAVHSPQVVERLLAMGESAGLPLANRAAAMDTLETQRRLSPAAIARVKAVALNETVDSVAWVATRTLGRVMKEDFERTGTYAPYWKELLEVGERSDDMAVRLLALEMPSYSNPLLDSASVQRLGGILRKDRERDVREMAAFRLAVTGSPDTAMEAYRSAFAQEQDLCVRWAIFRFAARLAGPDSLPTLAQFAQQDPRLRQDYLDFQALYASGEVDFARVWAGKKEHHNCLMEEGAPH